MQSSPLFQEIKLFFREFLPSPPESLCVAVSGGADSMALLYLLLTLKEELGIKRLGVAHVNHGLRGEESDADAQFVKAVAAKTGVPFHETILAPRHKKSGMELWARKARYDFFKKLMASEDYACVATGHTANDQAETALMRIMRGCGLKGLCGIEPVRRDGAIRPLLYTKRSALRAWLLASGKTFREDSSNYLLDYTRNRLRARVLPELEARTPGTTDMLIQIARSAQTAWTMLQPCINKWIDAYVVQKRADAFTIKKAGFYREPFAEECVAQVLRKKEIDFQQCHIESLLAAAGKTNTTVLLSGGWSCKTGWKYLVFSRDKNGKIETVEYTRAFRVSINPGGKNEDRDTGVIITTEIKPPETLAKPPFSSDNLTVFLDAKTVGDTLEFRSIQPNDVFWPLGSRGQHNIITYLKKQKKDAPMNGIVAKPDGEVVWIPGVQIGHGVRVTPQTRTILKISYTCIR